MSFEKVAEQDGREVWLAALSSPEDAASWAATARPGCGVLVFLDADAWDADQLDRFVEATLKFQPSEVAAAGSGATDLEDAFDQELALHPREPVVLTTAHPDDAVDEAVWYMFFATITGLPPGELRQPPLIVAFREGDERIEAFRRISARFAAAMNDVLERE
jgi:hypothetical protein